MARTKKRDQIENMLSGQQAQPGNGGPPESTGDARARDLLAESLEFFLDGRLLAALENSVLPLLFASRDTGLPIRVWVPHCGTGAAAHAIAILLSECAGQLAEPPPIQIFATDSDEAAIAIARKALYPEAIQTAIAPEQVWRYFSKQQGQYQLKKSARDLVIFAVHDLLYDPPFTRLDLIVCARVLSAFGAGVQNQLLHLFHYALRPDGFLALGVSEPIDLVNGLFSAVGDMPRLCQRRSDISAGVLNVLNRSSVVRPKLAPQPSDVAPTIALRDLHLGLLARHGPTSVLLDENYTVVHLSRRDSWLFRMPEGQLSWQIVDIIINDLRLAMWAALLSAAHGAGPIETPPVLVRLNGVNREIRILVRLLDAPEWARGYFLVIFDEHAGDQASGDGTALHDREAEARPMSSPNQWQWIINQYETALAEQHSASDELQAANQKLQVLSQEFETSQEQLWAVNERLRSINDELRRRVVDLTRANNDLNNLIGAADIPMLFLDKALQITRFSPQAQNLFHLIPTDLGRPLAHITHRLDYDGLVADCANLLITLRGVEREVRDADGCWYMAQLRPYRTADERIEGVVLAFVDITTRKQATEGLRQARDELEQRVAERTHELATLNTSLQAEMAKRMRLEEARKELLRKLVTLQEDERRRIARELHDQLGQSVSALGIGLAILANPAVEAEQHRETLARLQELAVQIDKDMNRLALDLRPTALDDLGLVAALQYLVEHWAEHSHIHAEFQASGLAMSRLSSEVESVIYRVVQEALTNVLKHAQAQRVSIILEQRDNQVNVIVEDDGRGFDFDALQQAPSARRRLGLLGMQERVALVGGSFTVDAAPGVGTTLFARIPLQSFAAE